MLKTWGVVAAAAIVLGTAGIAQAGGDAAAGEKKAKACIGCHGKDGKGKGKNPPAVGLGEAKFIEEMNKYKSGERKHKMMQKFTKKLSDADIANLAAYYETLK